MRFTCMGALFRPLRNTCVSMGTGILSNIGKAKPSHEHFETRAPRPPRLNNEWSNMQGTSTTFLAFHVVFGRACVAGDSPKPGNPSRKHRCRCSTLYQIDKFLTQTIQAYTSWNCPSFQKPNISLFYLLSN